LGSSVKGSQFRDQLSRVFGGIYREGFGDDIKSLTEFGDGDLFLGVIGATEGVEMDAECDIDGSSSGDDLPGLKRAFGYADGVMDGSN
jgi:hypothetical protein